MSKQPVWKLLANLGDANPIDYGGYFVYEDTTGVYPEEAEKLISPDSDESGQWIVYRFCLDRLKQVQIDDTVYLVPAKYDESWPHPVAKYDEWFHEDLSHVAEFVGQTLQELRDAFCSDDPRIRSMAYEALAAC